MKICVFIKHHRFADERVFHKQIQTLKGRYFSDIYFVAPEPDMAIDQAKTDGLNLLIIQKNISYFSLFQKLRRLNCEVYHFHDPQFVLMGVILRLFGKKVVYDVHEDYSAKLKSRLYLKGGLRYIVPAIWDYYRASLCKIF